MVAVYQAGIFAQCREIQMNPQNIKKDDFPIAFESISKTASIIVRYIVALERNWQKAGMRIKFASSFLNPLARRS